MHTRMHEKVKSGEAIDISKCKREGNYYILENFDENKEADYCDLELECWVWSIGKRNSDGAIHASLIADLFMNPNYKCVWLR